MFQIKTKDDKRFMEAAKAVLAKFKAGKIKAKEFNMNSYRGESCSVNHECKTTHCIGGWIGVELGSIGNINPVHDNDRLDLDLNMDLMRAAENLFNPTWTKPWRSSKTRAIMALERFVKRRVNDPWKGVYENDKEVRE